MFALNSLGPLPIFKGLQESQLNALSELANLRTFERGERLIARGEVVKHFYIIKQGRFSLTTILYTGRKSIETALETKSAGEALGWSALVEARESVYSVYCVWPSEVIEFRRDELQNFLAANTKTGYPLMRNVTQLVGDRERTLQNLWREEVEQDPERVKFWLKQQVQFG